MGAYVQGNVVRKETTPVSTRTRTQSMTKQHTRATRRQVLHMNKGYVMFLAIAAVVALFACVQYLQLQSDITERSQYITSLQRELSDAKEENTTRYNVIMNSMNLQEIRDIAMNEFGMTYVEPEQVVKYQSPDGSSVKQYWGIPKSGVVASSDVVQ